MIDVRLKKRFPAFDIDIHFTTEGTGITVLAGPSGSGKTSVINMIAGLVEPDEGRILINDDLLFDFVEGINLPIQKRRCGYIFQDGRLFPHMSVRRNLLYGPCSDRARLGEITELLGIGHLLDRMPGKLSGGEKQRVAIGRALLMRPKILLMDEPLASLDPERKDELLPYIARLPGQFGIPIFYVTHSRREILRLSDVLIRIDKGRVTSSGRAGGEYAGLGAVETEEEYLSVFECHLEEFDTRFGVISAGFPGGTVRIQADQEPQERSFKAAIRASDVIISLDQPGNISTRNIFKARVLEVTRMNHHGFLVHTDAGVPIAARITKASVDRLDLKPGREVYLLVKAVSLYY
jgi:molybdate transport system ATP-binding protein